MTSLRTLVTGVGGPAGGSLARQLLSRGVPVIGTDSADIHLPGVIVRKVPPANDPALPMVLRRIVAEHRIDLVVPTVSEELPVLASSDGKLGTADVVLGAPRAIRSAGDKLLTARRLRACGVVVPDFALPSDFGDFASAVSALGSPVLVKPRVSRGGRGVRVLHSANAADWGRLDDRWIVQQFAPGTEYAPVVYRADGVDRRLDLVVVLEKLALTGGAVGNATGVRRVADSAAADVSIAAIAAVQAIGLTGPADVDIRRLPDGRAAVLEINARFGANSAAAPELIDRVLTAAGKVSEVAS